MQGLQLKYFVLKPSGQNEYAIASRTAMLTYAKSIEDINFQLADDIRNWVFLEKKRAELDVND